ncbi:stress response protein [bacterium]|nr:stress response protein [bacterium]
MPNLKAKVVLKTKGEETYVSLKQLMVTLKWTTAVDLDLMAFYKAKDGQVGGIFSDNYAGGSMGNLNSFPFIQLSGDAGVGAVGGENEENLRITKLDDMAEVYICTINFTDAVRKRSSTFNNYDGHIHIVDDKGGSVAVPLDSTQPGTVAVIARIDNTGFMGAKLVNENRIMDMAAFQSTIPGANLLKLSSKIVLKQKGDKVAIPIKNFQATLSWTAAVDLDLHAYFKPKATSPPEKAGFLKKMLLGAGSEKSKKEGCVYFSDRGSKTSFPWIYLDKDAGVGDVGGQNEENLYFTGLQRMEHILIVANIFNKPDANFASYDGKITLKADGQSFEVPLTATTGGSYCIIARINNSGPSGPVLVNVNKVQRERPTVNSFLQL